MSTEPEPALPQPGDLFASRYRIASLLGKGGFGAVYQARDTSLERDVALKVLMRTTDEQSLARFLREARASAALASEHVATVYEVGTTGDGPYIVMELLRGCDLQDELDDRTKLPIAEAVDHVLQAALGIAHAHARGIVHRDLKPRNLFLARRDDGTTLVKVLDFGIAKSTATDLTQTGTTLGTPRYMAPEQLRSARTVDARTDVWALGVVLYELVSGKPIFDDATATQLAVSIVIDPHVPLRDRDPGLSADLAVVVDRCLEKEPHKRYPDVHALAAAIAPFATATGQALVSRIERALGDRASSALAKSAATDATVQLAPKSVATDATVQLAPPTAGTDETIEAPSASTVKATRDAATKRDAETRDKQAPAPVPLANDAHPGSVRADRGNTDARADRSARVADRGDKAARADRGNHDRAANEARPQSGTRGSQANRVTIIALLVAAVAIAIAVAMWMRTSKTSTPIDAASASDAAAVTATATDAVTATTSVSDAVAVAVSASDAATASVSDAVAVSASDAATVSVSDAVAVSASDAATASDAARVPTDAARTTDAGITRPSADAASRLPARTPQVEIDGITNWCLNRRSAPTFVVPNNDGPGTMQCGRMALLGCVGLRSACSTRPITDQERQQCRDFLDVLRTAEVCK